ncbi:branched-chain amino acid ABC transporter permease [Actinobacteria bacterium YIM 96077]|uniref:Branched-chain amino acid ABC transporter permease n=2 Tax=Phytoactinopolyspora halophila TaxID=1981511 RepID=A0A329QNV0_9ACTN|nr:branched-chain amino acid ABC transporter permease [Actinobacteria bacterium YIM 96077]RAW13846.1 branched-chain amino acid ABC transporter permease [Phytoactinopolyspora halophila]
MEFVFFQLLNGLSFAGLLFLVASGFTLIFGLMRVVNLAHGGFYLVGGYIGLTIVLATGNIWLAALGGALAVGVLGVLMETSLLRRVRGQELPEVLLTIGVAFMLGDLTLAFWGGDPRAMPLPDYLSGSVDLGFIGYPRFRVLVTLLAVAVGIALWLLMSKTRVGAIVRAGVDDREMIAALGINIRLVFTGLFFFGALLAGLSGVVGAAFLGLVPGESDIEILLFALVVVILGGLGSLPGAAIGSVIVGLIDAFAKALVPELAFFTLFAPMAIVLVLRPEGLLGRRA